MEEEIHMDDDSRKLARTIIGGVAITVITAVLIGAFAQWRNSAAIEAATDQRVGAVEARMTALEERFDHLDALDRSVTALGTKVDTWRQSDTTTRALERAQLEQRLSRIEQALDRRLRR
ncbi:MAG: hypothetical protein RLO52_34435 [Sandaracinaceae bacterium]